ncbi:helix-turn-helix domain-containing protein [Yoonia vestfoldensis]|uniref:helix-turn-helix domain-containing protein n=1 Tax=Yoonia vestfoldensis TaxID=245188 RepID=UPI0003AA6F54|nr:helix-turn-helix transcriptional regulator [Yoonia vestfoldensis]
MDSFARTLKNWRQTRRMSQLDLALTAEVSSRHISFLETGRARPSRAMIARLGDALQMPLAPRNTMLLQAGFAPLYPARPWDDAAMAPVRTAVAHTLQRHAPFPGIAIDQLWRIVQMNAPAARLFGGLGLVTGDSLLDAMTGAHLPQAIANWPDVAHHAAQRLRLESLAQGGVPELDRAAACLGRVQGQSAEVQEPFVPMKIMLGDLCLSLFATIAQFGTAADLTLHDLRIELYFPADDATRKLLESPPDDSG